MKGLIFTYLMTYGGAAVALLNPFIGLLVYCCFAIVRPESMWHWAVPHGGNYSRIIAICLLLGWAARGFGDWNFGRARGIVFAFSGYMLWIILSTLFVTDYVTKWTSLENASKIYLPFIVGVTTVRTIGQVRTLAWTLMFSQAYVALDQNLNWVYGDRSIITYGFSGMDNNCVAIAMVAGAGLAFYLGMTTDRQALRWSAFIAAGLMAHYPMFADSRGGMLGLIVTGLIGFIFLPKQPKHYIFFLVAVAVGLRLAGPMVWGRFNTTFASQEYRDDSAQSRLDLWRDAWSMTKRYPVFGVGPDNFPVVAVEYGWPAGKECHSLWVNIMAELGLPGITFLLAFYMLTLFHLWQFACRTMQADPWQAALAQAVVASLIGFMVSAQFVSLEGLEFPYYVVLVGAAILKLAPAPRSNPEPFREADPWLQPSA